MRSQALGLAEAVGLPVIEKRSFLRPPWSWLPGGAISTPLSALDPAADRLEPPWPRLVVCCGRRSIGPALAVKRRSGGRTIAAYVQNPELARAKFDLVVAMRHDSVSGPNVMIVDTALHRVTPARMTEAREEWHSRLACGTPLIGVLIGGDNPAYKLTDTVVAKLVETLRRAHDEAGFGAVLTPSRRTGEPATRMLEEALGSEKWAHIWDGTGDNPYFGILALSDRLIVTGESISMISEALATGRPVHVLPLEGHGRRHDAFLSRIRDERLVSIIEDSRLDPSFAGSGAVNATDHAADRLRALLSRQTTR